MTVARRRLRRCAAWSLALIGGASACRGAASDDQLVTLRFWAFGREGEVVASLVQDFEATHPGIRVQVQQIPWRAAHEKLLTAYVGETLPDVAQLGNTWVPEFDALGALLPLDSLIAAYQWPVGDFFPGIWATNVIDGRTLGVPWYVDTRAMFYRADLLAKAGITAMPTTWDAWVDAMRRVRALSGGRNFAVFIPVNEWAQSVVLAQQTGSPLLGERGTRGDFQGPEFRKALGFLLKLFADSLAPIAGTQQIANLYQEFARGYFAMYISGPWNIGEFARRMPPELRDAWATAPLPGPYGDSSRVSLAGGSSLSVLSSSKHVTEAWALLTFLSQPEQQAQFYRLSGDLPARKTAWQDSSLAQNTRAAAFFDQLQRVQPLPAVPEWEQIATKVQEYVEAVIRGSMRQDDALAALDRDVDIMLEKRRWLLERRRVVSR